MLTTASGLLFGGDADGAITAYDARTGRILWNFQTGASILATPAPRFLRLPCRATPCPNDEPKCYRYHMREAAFHWIAQHGYAGIFSLLVFGIVGLPVPDEWLLTFSGYLVFKHTLRFAPTFVAAFLGSACGISFSYMLGRIFDTYVIVKYGSIVHITSDKMARVHDWFERRGRWALLIGYFVPGVRHLTGYVAGASKLDLSNFMLFAYTGAFCWAAIFISLGYVLGEEWNRVLGEVHDTRVIVIGVAIVVLLGYLAVGYLRRKRPTHA